MALTLNVDRKQTVEPDDLDIAREIGSIDSSKGLGSGISLIILSRDSTHWICASGHPLEGFALSYQDGDAEWEYCNKRFLPPAEIIKIFQAFARGGDWGKAGFDWEAVRTARDLPRWIRWLLLGGFFGCLVYLILKSALNSR